MTCEQFRTDTLDRERGELLDAAVLATLHAHLDDCPSCAAWADDSRALGAALAAWAADTSTTGAPARVEARLVEAFRAERALRSAPTIPGHVPTSSAGLRRGGVARVPPAWWAVAAALVAGVISGAELVRTGLVGHPTVSAGQRSLVLASLDDEDSGYVTIASAPPLLSGDPMPVVHVSMTRAALASMGVHVVNPGEWTEEIDVEMAVGEDGIPRAVRITNE